MAEKKKKYLLYGLRVLLTVLLLAFLFSVWPGYLVHDYYLSKTNSSQYVKTQVLPEYTLVTQYFVPQHTYLSDIQFALEYNEKTAKNKVLSFELRSKNGNLLLSRNIPMEEIKSGLYYNVPINKRLKIGDTYYWSLIMPDDINCECQMMYTENAEETTVENLLFLINGVQYGDAATQTVSLYRYYVHPDKMIILGVYWISGILVYIVCLELLNRCFKV